MNCPHCKKGEIHVHVGGRMCGCDTCKSIFRYPSMVPFPVESIGEPAARPLYALASEVAEAPTVVKSHFGGKFIAMFSDKEQS